MKTPHCPDCKVAMKEGWLTDYTFGGNLQSHFHDGPPEKVRVLGMHGGVKANGARMMPIQAFRCPDRGFIRLYAFPKKWNRVE